MRIWQRLGLLVGVMLITSVAGAQGNRRIARIETEGLRALKPEHVVDTSGLKVGDAFSVAALDAAAQRLIDSGLFKKVSYRTRTVGAAVTITFELEEAGGHVSPVVFDNFIWFTDEQLAAAVRKKLPFFDGTAPEAGNATSLIREALQEMLTERKLPGTIEYALTGSEGSSQTVYLFRVADPSLTICTLHFPGAHDIPEDKLVAVTKSSTDTNYSRESMTVFPQYGLFPMYREIGHWRTRFGPPLAKPDTNPGCEGKVDLTITVNEGAAYAWAGALWSGNQALPAKDLDSALGMKSGEVANGKKFDRGLRDIQKAYGKFGYIEAHPNPEPVFDDAKHEVTFRIAVVEGPQYRMGTVQFTGVSPADAAALQGLWKLKSGDIYDASYSDRFFREDGRMLLSRIFQERRSMQKQGPPLEIRARPNRKTLTVDVTVEIKN